MVQLPLDEIDIKLKIRVYLKFFYSLLSVFFMSEMFTFLSISETDVSDNYQDINPEVLKTLN